MAKVKTVGVSIRRNVAHPMSNAYAGYEHQKDVDKSILEALKFSQLHCEVTLQAELTAKDAIDDVVQVLETEAASQLPGIIGRQWQAEIDKVRG